MAADANHTQQKRLEYEAAGWQFARCDVPGRVLMCRPRHVGMQWHLVGDDECDCIAANMGKVCSHLKALLDIGDAASLRAALEQYP